MGLQSEGWFNLPQMANPGTTAAFAYVVPASGLVAGLPSPQQLAGNDLILSPSTQGVPIVGYGTTPPTNTVAGGPFDSIPFDITVSGRYNSHATQNLTVAVYQVTNATLSAWTSATGAVAPATAGTIIASSGALAAGNNTKNNFFLKATLIWDSGSKNLNALAASAQVGGTVIASGQQTAQTGIGSLNINDLNFIVSFLFSAGTAADWVTPYEFVISQ